MIEYSAKIEGMDEVIKMLKGTPEAVDKAIVSSVNKLAESGIVKAKKEITGAYNLKKSDLQKAFLLVRAQRQGKRGVRMHAEIIAHGRGLYLYDFKALPKNPPRQKGIPIARRKKTSVQIMKGGERTALPHAFIARMSSGHVGVFYRSGGKMAANPKRSAIKEKFEISAASMFEKKAVGALNGLIASKGTATFEHELNFYLGNLTKGIS